MGMNVEKMKFIKQTKLYDKLVAAIAQCQWERQNHKDNKKAVQLLNTDALIGSNPKQFMV